MRTESYPQAIGITVYTERARVCTHSLQVAEIARYTACRQNTSPYGRGLDGPLPWARGATPGKGFKAVEPRRHRDRVAAIREKFFCSGYGMIGRPGINPLALNSNGGAR
jgi:hypothetical protein